MSDKIQILIESRDRFAVNHWFTYEQACALQEKLEERIAPIRQAKYEAEVHAESYRQPMAGYEGIEEVEMTDRKEIEIQGAEAGREHDVPYYYWAIVYEDKGQVGINATSVEDDAFFNTPEQIDEIIKALQEAKTWLK